MRISSYYFTKQHTTYNMRLVIILVTFLCFSCSHGQKIQVAVYYESLCPHSSAFIINQLYPYYEALMDYIEVLFVPFGKSVSTNNGSNFTCQHGDEECVGNTIQSCGLYALAGQTIRISNYIYCQMAVNNDRTGRFCAEKNGIKYSDLQRCVNGGLGRLLQIEAERVTHKIRKPYPMTLPTIVFNNVFDEGLQHRAVTNFINLVCDMINKAAPTCNFIPW